MLSLILISINRLGHAFLGRSCPRKTFAAEKQRKAQTQLGSDPSWRLEQAQNVAIKHPKPPGFNNLRKLLGVLWFLVSFATKITWILESFWGLRSVRFYLNLFKGPTKKKSPYFHRSCFQNDYTMLLHLDQPVACKNSHNHHIVTEFMMCPYFYSPEPSRSMKAAPIHRSELDSPCKGTLYPL